MMRIATRTGAGFSLVEVLVAMLVLSIGLLGLAKLQVAGVRYNHSSYLRTQATLAAYDILERMRANRAQAQAGAYDTWVAAPPTAPPLDCGLNTVDCSPANLAAYDRAQWKCSLGRWEADAACVGLGARSTLPNGTGTVAYNPATSAVNVVVTWQEQGNDAQTLALNAVL